MKHKKYNLILGTDDNSHSIIAYRKTSRGYSIEPLSKVLGLNKKEYQFMQSEIDSIKSNLDDPKQRAIVDLAKHEVKEPLYYMQSTRSNECGERLFFMRAPSFSGLEDLSYTLFPSIEEAMYGWSKMIYLGPKEEVAIEAQYMLHALQYTPDMIKDDRATGDIIIGFTKELQPLKLTFDNMEFVISPVRLRH